MSNQEISSAIILGTVGDEPQELFKQFPGMELSERKGPVSTPYASIYYYEAQGCDLSFYVMERHNCTGKLMYPHQLQMTAAAIMYFLTQIRGVKIVVSTGAVGAANGNNFADFQLRPGTIVVPADFMDLSGEVTSFASGPNTKIKKLAGAHCAAGNHTVCSWLRNRLVNHSLVNEESISLDNGVLSCVPGPRFETGPEKTALFNMGVDLFGMHTTQRDWVLCQELQGVHFLPLLHVTNMVFENPEETGLDVDRQAKENFIQVMENFFRVLKNMGEVPVDCDCHKRQDIFDFITVTE